MEVKIKDLENQIKNIKFKADLTSNIEHNISKRRTMTIKSKLSDKETQTEKKSGGVCNSARVNNFEFHSPKEKWHMENNIETAQISQNFHLPLTRIVMKRSKSIGKLEKIRKNRLKRNNSQLINSELSNLAQLLTNEISMLYD
jgi:hypothetical protein